MEYIRLAMINIQKFGWEIIAMLEMLCLAGFIQRVIFLEYHTREQQKRMVKLAGICSLGFACVVIFPGINVVFWGLGIILCSGIPFVYGGYAGRKKYKWLAFFEWIPLVGYMDGLLLLLDCFTDNMQNESKVWFVQAVVIFFILLILILLIWKQPRFVSTLIKDIQNRTLSMREEFIVWGLGIWLFAYDVVLRPNIENHATKFVVNYISILNFVFAVGIVLFIINSNYRDYYFKSNMRLQKSLISAMAELVENRDENTGGHIQRTSLYVEIIAKELQKNEKYRKILTDEYIEDMVIAAPLHDVGKIHIPDAILNKPGKLDTEEFSTMKTHAAAGSLIIDHIEASTGEIEYLRIAKEMAEYHHERMDGKGYPHGITGDKIPLCARILAVADVFDAVTSKRCYKDAMPMDVAFAIIEEEAGTHFDTDVANAFLNCREQVEKFMLEHKQ